MIAVAFGLRAASKCSESTWIQQATASLKLINSERAMRAAAMVTGIVKETRH